MKNFTFKANNVLLLLILFCSFVVNAQNAPTFNNDPKPVGKAWQKVENMSDEFNNGTVFDTNKWHKNPTGNGWSWIGREPGLFEEDAVVVSGGNLRCTVLKYNTPKVVNGKTWLYRGGIIRSLNSAGAGHYFEAKMKANATEMSSTFWLKPRITCGKNLELDIQECIGQTGPLTQSYAQGWDSIMHSNMFNFKTDCGPDETVQIQGSVITAEKNHSRYFIYGCYVESPTKVHFYLDGVYQYSITPPRPYDLDMFITMAMETYDWNPVPAGGGKVASGTWAERTTQYDWVRTWKLVDAPSTTFHIQNRGSGKIIRPQTDVANGIVAQAPTSWTGNWTQWEAIDVDGTYFHLKNKQTGKFLRPATTDLNASVIQSTTGINAQWQTQWKKVTASDGYFYLQNRWTARYIRPIGDDDLDASTGNDFGLQQVETSLTWHYTQWRFVNVGSSLAQAVSTDLKTLDPSINFDVLQSPLQAGYLHLEVPASENGATLVTLYTSQGNAVFTEETNKTSTVINTSTFAKGIYLVEIIANGDRKVKKVIVE
ncbi:T9SS type A sorting domain-containing protein [Wenyingzhuangia aestuarii]|uniref:T9SS type A sorting domain-containing protein n=1 Tax=Wenyingzhuangia aestuarii TaxID=1647582 RepID=UPI00143A7C38|nr:T9SS type A sorting domain-containing protein [Wenyingzhuangia aestuarii]NJB81845.1 hypothetical protein [Wenyingzhuangia aestuarii]